MLSDLKQYITEYKIIDNSEVGLFRNICCRCKDQKFASKILDGFLKNAEYIRENIEDYSLFENMIDDYHLMDFSENNRGNIVFNLILKCFCKNATFNVDRMQLLDAYMHLSKRSRILRQNVDEDEIDEACEYLLNFYDFQTCYENEITDEMMLELIHGKDPYVILENTDIDFENDYFYLISISFDKDEEDIEDFINIFDFDNEARINNTYYNAFFGYEDGTLCSEFDLLHDNYKVNELQRLVERYPKHDVTKYNRLFSAFDIGNPDANYLMREIRSLYTKKEVIF